MSCLGPYAKYSSCLYPTGKETLEEAEILMMESYCQKARLKDGLDILELGSGDCHCNDASATVLTRCIKDGEVFLYILRRYFIIYSPL